MSHFTLRLLGPVSIEARGESSWTPLNPSFAGLLAFLALQGKPVARDHLASLFWPRAESAKGRHSLRQLLSRLRKAFPGLIITDNERVGVDASVLEVDVHRFEVEIRERRIRSALELWRGPFLEGWSWGDSWELEDWVDRERMRLERLLERTVVEVAETLLDAERPKDAGRLLEASVSALPLSDEIPLLRARALAASGYRPEAEAILLSSDLDEGDRRVAATWDEVRNGNGPVPVPVEEGTGSEDAGLEAEGHEETTPGPDPGSEVAADRSPAPPAPVASSWFLEKRTWLALAGAAVGAWAVLGLRGVPEGNTAVAPPIPPVEIWFCSHRETEYAFQMNGDGGEKFSLSQDEVCPVIPVNGGERAVTIWAGPGDAVLGTLHEGGFSPLPGTVSSLGYSTPERQAGPLDGIIDPDGRTMVVVLEVEPGATDSSDLLRWPDGIGRVDPMATLDLFLIDLDTGARTRLTEDAARDYEPRFLPDGSGIVWGSQRDGPGDLYLRDLESGEVRRLTYGTLPARDPSVQGSRIAFHRGWGDGEERGDQELFLLDLDTGEELRLTENDWNDTGAELSSDGRMICWTSKRDGHFEAEIMAMELETGAVWTVSEGLVRGDFCQWHPSAPVMFFQGWDGGEEDIYRSSWGGKSPHMNLSRYVGQDVAPSIFLVEGQARGGR